VHRKRHLDERPRKFSRSMASARMVIANVTSHAKTRRETQPRVGTEVRMA
jgi:hypothetical protein